jgi:beta-glucosidase
MNQLRFPDGFLWGAATAAYQIEGAPGADGKGASIWDTFSHTPGKVWHGDTGDTACDSYRRYSEDIAMLERLGVGAYRFSLSWPRIQADGRGAPNAKGLDHYKRLADALGEKGIEPVVTLYHWDLPQALQDKGGWATREVAEIFGEFAAIAGEALGDRVKRWITINEPWVVEHVGYREGRHAPGVTDTAAATAATHHLLLAHGHAATALRAASPRAAEIGITLNLGVIRPVTPEAASFADELDARQNGVFLGPLLHGAYPERLTADYSPARVPGLVRDGDFGIIQAPADFLGVNFYAPTYVGVLHPDGEPRRGETIAGPGVVTVQPDGMPVTAMNWLVEPDSIYELMTRLRDEAPGLPIYITENGSSWYDYVTQDGAVHDPERTGYLRSHLAALHRAIADGVDLRGYFAWSLLDNFEWAEGYAKRFGLVYVDFATQKRILKDSGAFYAGVTRANALPGELAGGPRYVQRLASGRGGHPGAVVVRVRPVRRAGGRRAAVSVASRRRDGDHRRLRVADVGRCVRGAGRSSAHRRPGRGPAGDRAVRRHRRRPRRAGGGERRVRDPVRPCVPDLRDRAKRRSDARLPAGAPAQQPFHRTGRGD